MSVPAPQISPTHALPRSVYAFQGSPLMMHNFPTNQICAQICANMCEYVQICAQIVVKYVLKLWSNMCEYVRICTQIFEYKFAHICSQFEHIFEHIFNLNEPILHSFVVAR